MMRLLPKVGPAIVVLGLTHFGSSVCGHDADYSAYYLYVGQDPDNEGPAWGVHPRGIAHNDTHWLIIQEDQLWAIPVETDLGSVHDPFFGVRTLDLRTIPRPPSPVIGDPCAYRSNAGYYLLVPIATDRAEAWYLAVFRTETTLEFIDIAPIPDQRARNWCGIDDDGFLYSSGPNVLLGNDRVVKFGVDWELLDNGGGLSIWFVRNTLLRNEDGTDSVGLKVQNGDVSPDGRFAYLVYEALGDDHDTFHIAVFDLQSGRRVRRSTYGYGPFNFHVGSDATGGGETTPRGVTIWDLARTPSPHRGELHVLIEDYDAFSSNEISVKHYTRTIRVDGSSAEMVEAGTPEFPFRTLSGALDLAWDGAEVCVRAGAYRETMTINRRIRLTAEDGTARIGG